MKGGISAVQRGVGHLDPDRTAVRHRIAGVDRKVENRVFELAASIFAFHGSAAILNSMAMRSPNEWRIRSARSPTSLAMFVGWGVSG